MQAPAEGARRIYPPVYFALSTVLMLVLHFLAPVGQILHGPARWLGAIPMVGGVAVALWVGMMFRRAGTTIKPFEKSSSLVTTGPYLVTRNPIYLGMVSFLLGVAVAAGSFTPFLVVPAFAWWIDRRFIRVEEEMLEQAFGARYADYKASVRRWL